METLSNQIYLSRDQIRLRIIEYVKKYLELENVDLTKTSFLSYLINVISTLTSNLLFYETSVYREFFLTTAQLPESILNLSAFLGYNTKEARYAITDVLVKIPLTFEDNVARFSIPQGHKFYASDIQFTTYYRTDITVHNNAYASVVVVEENRTYNLPVIIDTTSSTTPQMKFILPVRQYKETTQEFQIDADLKPYQFVTIDVPIKGKVTALSVAIKSPGATSWRLYEEFQSLYLMSPTDYGYVSRRTITGRKLYFGNGLIGVQPEPNSTVLVTVRETEGADGNVIAGSITRGDRIYYTNQSGITKIVNYTVVNPSSAVNGEDEESIEEIRSNAIANLSALGRLVSEEDYKNSNVVIPYPAMNVNPVPVLKRSDVKVNDIQLFTCLIFNDVVVPTRNEKILLPLGTTYLPRGTVIEDQDGFKYYTLFDITLDYINTEAYYHYIMSSSEFSLTLAESFGSTYDIVANSLKVQRSGSGAIFELTYYSSEPDYGSASCIMQILETGETFTFTNVPASKKFVYTFSDYTTIREGETTFLFTLLDSTAAQVATYSCTFAFRMPLKSFMMSNVVVDGTSVIVYDVPVVEKTYYDSINQDDFELVVLQKMLSSFSIYKYRMLTDFTNLKFANTTGRMTNMKFNKVTRVAVKDSGLCSVPPDPAVGDRYIVSGYEEGAWLGRRNNIAQCIANDSTSGVLWSFTEPSTNDIVYVTEKKTKLIYTGTNWVVPEFTVPLQIELEVFKSKTYVGSDTELSNTIKSKLVSEFESRFGPTIELYRSEIIRTVQEIDGVDHCNLISPYCDIFFNYDLESLTQEELLEYTPEYVFFTTFDISIKILT